MNGNFYAFGPAKWKKSRLRAILTFHSIDNSGSVLSFPVNAFKRLMTALALSETPVVGLSDILSVEEGVVITFDDGMKSIRDHALPVLNDLKFRAHLFLTTGAVGESNNWPTQPVLAPRFSMLDWDDIEQCQAGGMRIEAHTHTHPDLRQLTEQEIETECNRVNQIIECRTGRTPKHFAYPYGYWDSRIAAAISQTYDSAVTTDMKFVGKRKPDPYGLPRLDSYYFQNGISLTQPFGLPSRTYLELRRTLRIVRKAVT